MLTKILLLNCALTIYLVNSQFNGEFWWLSDKVKKLNGGEVEPAKFEELNEFDNDESDKITFNNDLDVEDKTGEGFKDRESKALELHFPGADVFVWPQDFAININKNNTKCNETSSAKAENVTTTTTTAEGTRDEFQFHFPDDGIVWQDTSDSIPPVQPKPNSILQDKLHPKPIKEDINYENVCTYLEEKACKQADGLVHKHRKRSNKMNMKYFNELSVCCILPIKLEARSTRIVFPEPQYKSVRFRRSTKDKNAALDQRKALLLRRFASQYQSYVSTAFPQITKKIVTEDNDYEDPYDNVKNVDFKTPSPNFNKKPFPNTYYGGQDYEDDYTEELPKPGLTGLYSDHGTIPGSWTFLNDDSASVGDEYDDDVGYGVSTVDPRLDRRKTSTQLTRKPSQKLSTTSEESDYRTGSETIRYQSNPDFQVLQGFKLLNLVRNRSRIYTKNTRKSTTESISDEDIETSAEHLVSTGYAEYDDFGDVDTQVYKKCGEAKESQINDRQSNEGPAHPWLLLTIRTQRTRTTLCHATLVHPRAAVTAALCVHKATTGEVIIKAGLSNINDNSEESQQRIATVFAHPRYSKGNLANNLAILYWKRPLRLSASVQPICLGDPVVGDSCDFVGWGGQGQVIHTRARWQRAKVASVRECSACLEKRHTRPPRDAFCALLETSGCVTSGGSSSGGGGGGSLTCQRRGRRRFAAGVMTWRASCDVTAPAVMLPLREWVYTTLHDLGVV